MNKMINTESGERVSFFKLLSEKKYRTLIPIIQRDYAQGRMTFKGVRDGFLDALYQYLNENIPNRDLDFVYGTLKENSDFTDFIPLDGQQRLTTLFLLHWYLYQISDNTDLKDRFKSSILKEGKSMFTYETRSSSSEFCDALVQCHIDFSNLLDANLDTFGISMENQLSNTIKNSSWFFLSWKYDPTIQSMLTMLDAIHKRFYHSEVFFERLLNVEQPIITFLFLNLKDFRMTDDLYIKMNSRGKPLTPFENFKAKFEQYLGSIKSDRLFTLSLANKRQNVSLREYFSHNIDTKWADLFWNYRTLQNRANTAIDNDFDDELMNFIRVIFTNQYAMDVDVTLKARDETLEYLMGTVAARKSSNYSDELSFVKYEELNALSRDSVLYLIDALDCFVNGNDKIKLYLPKKSRLYFDESKIFKNALKHSFESNQERLCFHAYIRYLIYNKYDHEGIVQWMRVIYNLTHPENSSIDNSSEVASAIKSIEELLPFGNNILNHLKENPGISLFSSWQVLEEKIKAHLITKSDEWKNLVETIEKHAYFNGQIGFIIEFSGILTFYNTHKHCNWSSQENSVFLDKFSNYATKASVAFNESYENRVNDEEYIFERAVLSKGDYLTEASQDRRNLLSTNLVKNNIKRDHSWKRLLRITDDELWTEKRSYVKQVFDDKRYNSENIKNSLRLICNDKTNSWRDYFISSPELINYCNQGFIRFSDENSILLYGESQSNHLHVEMYTYHFWKKYIEPKKSSFNIFKSIYYEEVRSIYEQAYIRFSDFCHNKIYYQLDIYQAIDEFNSTYVYEIEFSKSKGKRSEENYGKDIKKILRRNGFQWSREYNAFYFSSYDRNIILEQLYALNKKLNI